MGKPERQIPVDSIAAWSANYHDTVRWGEDLATMPGDMLDDYTAVMDGKAALVLPDGRAFWCPVGGDLDAPRVDGDFGKLLLEYLLDHECVSCQWGARIPIVLFGVNLDPGTAFCLDCNTWVDLTKDGRTVDSWGTRVP